MKVILNKDLAPLGEEGDIKEVAKGYARNYLFPRGIALPYNERTIKLFESRKDEIDARKALKRQDAAGIKEKLEALALVIAMPAGPNGKLYGAVTGQTIMEELAKNGFQIERKKIELPGNTFKSVGKYKFTIKLYENASAECSITVEGQAIKTESRPAPAPKGRRRGRDEAAENPAVASGETAEAPAPEPAEAAAVTENTAPAEAAPETATTTDTPENAASAETGTGGE